MNQSARIKKQEPQDQDQGPLIEVDNNDGSVSIFDEPMKNINIAAAIGLCLLLGLMLFFSIIYDSQKQVGSAQKYLDLKHQRYEYSEINKIRQNNYREYLKQEEQRIIDLKKQQQSIDKIIQTRKYLKQYYTLQFPQRTKLERPKLAEYQFNMWKLFNPHSYNRGKNSCVFINSVGLVTKNNLNNIKKLLQHEEFGLVYILASRYDYKGEYLIEKSLVGIKKQMNNVVFDADYAFALSMKNQCSKLAYMFQNFVLNQEMINNIEVQIKNLRPSSLFYSSQYSKQKNVSVSLPDLSDQDLTLLQPQTLNKYLYIFDTEFLNVITPVNFLFYVKYTIEQILLMPILALYQSSNRLYTNKKIFHSFSVSFIQFKQITLKSIKQQNKSICYISYTNNPQTIDQKSLLSYLESIRNQTLFLDNENKTEMKLSIIIYLPYNLYKSPQLYSVAKQLVFLKKYHQNFRVRLRIQKEKALSSYAVYDSVYTYCPDKSLIVSSRHNVIFYKNMAKQLVNVVSESFHYFTFKIEKQNSQVISFEVLKYDLKEEKKQWNIYQKLQHVQVFKSDLLKTGVLYVLKSQQINFYETEASFVLLMMKLTFVSFNYLNITLAKVFVRQYTELELRQVKAVKSYGKMDGLVWNWLFPYKYNSLENQVMRRNAPKKIPANIHQIWFSSGKIDRIRQVLKNSLVQKNKNFTFYLWTKSNLTRENAPITYDLIERVLEHHKYFSKSLYAMAADIWRYQLIVTYGGLYIDFKFQGIKPLDNFLKYQNIFPDFDVGIIRYGVPKALGNPVMGGTKNNYYLKYILAELIREQKFQFDLIIPKVTGAYEIRKSLSDYQLFTGPGYGYYFFVPTPNPNEQFVNLCGGIKKTFDPDQEVFSINYYQSPVPILIGIPCKQYPYSYIINYHALGGTWVRNKTTAKE